MQSLTDKYQSESPGTAALATIEFWLIGGLAGASIVSEKLLPAVVIFGFLCLLIRAAVFRQFRYLRAFDLANLCLFLLLLVSLAVTPLPERTIPQGLRLLAGIFLAYAILHWAINRVRLAYLAAGLCALGMGLALAALFSVQWFTDKYRFIPLQFLQHMPAFGLDRVHPNVLAGVLVLLFVLIVCATFFYWSSLKNPLRLVLSVIGAAMGIVLLFTFSRGAVIGAAAAFAAAIILKEKRGWLLVLFFGLLGGILIAWVGPDRVSQLIINSSGSGNSLRGRLDIWSTALRMIADFPITGIGMGTFAEVADASYPFTYFSPATVPHAHNLYLQVAVDLGLPGLAAWAVLYVSVFRQAWSVYRIGKRDQVQWQIAAGAALICTLVALGVHGLFDSVTWGTRPAVLVWALWGTAAAAWNVSREPNSKQSKISVFPGQTSAEGG